MCKSIRRLLFYNWVCRVLQNTSYITPQYANTNTSKWQGCEILFVTLLHVHSTA